MRRLINSFFGLALSVMLLISSALSGNITARVNRHRVERAISSVKEQTDRLFERLDRLIFGEG